MGKSNSAQWTVRQRIVRGGGAAISRETAPTRHRGTDHAKEQHCTAVNPFSGFASTDAEMTIYVKPLARNANCCGRDNFESTANVTDTSDAHNKKQPSPMTSTDPGTAIDVKPLPPKAARSSRVNFESEANVTDTSDAHDEKQLPPMTSTDPGTAIHVKPLLKNAPRSSRDNFESAANVTDTSDAHD
jgi:hypothetical protein